MFENNILDDIYGMSSINESAAQESSTMSTFTDAEVALEFANIINADMSYNTARRNVNRLAYEAYDIASAIDYSIAKRDRNLVRSRELHKLYGGENCKVALESIFFILEDGSVEAGSENEKKGTFFTKMLNGIAAFTKKIVTMAGNLIKTIQIAVGSKTAKAQDKFFADNAAKIDGIAKSDAVKGITRKMSAISTSKIFKESISKIIGDVAEATAGDLVASMGKIEGASDVATLNSIEQQIKKDTADRNTKNDVSMRAYGKDSKSVTKQAVPISVVWSELKETLSPEFSNRLKGLTKTVGVIAKDARSLLNESKKAISKQEAKDVKSAKVKCLNACKASIHSKVNSMLRTYSLAYTAKNTGYSTGKQILSKGGKEAAA